MIYSSLGISSADGCIRWTDGGHICDRQESGVNRITLHQSTLNLSTVKEKIIDMVFISFERAGVYMYTCPNSVHICDSQYRKKDHPTAEYIKLFHSERKNNRYGFHLF